VKRSRFIIGLVFGIWGAYLVIHALLHFHLTDIASLIVGLCLVAVGVFSGVMLFRDRIKSGAGS